jgi:hypothetical protein
MDSAAVLTTQQEVGSGGVGRRRAYGEAGGVEAGAILVATGKESYVWIVY